MILSKDTAVKVFQIWSPKYSTRVVKLASYKIGQHNVIVFGKDADMKNLYRNDLYYVSGETAKKCPLVPMKTKSGATMSMREVPIDELEPFERG